MGLPDMVSICHTFFPVTFLLYLFHVLDSVLLFQVLQMFHDRYHSKQMQSTCTCNKYVKRNKKKVLHLAKSLRTIFTGMIISFFKIKLSPRKTCSYSTIIIFWNIACLLNCIYNKQIQVQRTGKMTQSQSIWMSYQTIVTFLM